MNTHVIYDLLVLFLVLIIIASQYMKKKKKKSKSKKKKKKIIKSINTRIKKLIIVFLYYTLRFFPKKKNLVIFGGEAGRGFRGNPKYLFIEMCKQDNLVCIWISKNKKVVNYIRSLGYSSHYAKSVQGIWAQLRARLLIHSHSIHEDFIRVLVGGAISINTWHGVGLKKVWGARKDSLTYRTLNSPMSFKKKLTMIFLNTTFAKENFVISTSDRVSSYYPETFNVDNDHILTLGQARNDIFFMETNEDNDVPDWIKKNRVITYMPTHRRNGKLDKPLNKVLDFKKLNEFCEKHDIYFLIKQHMYSKGKIPQRYNRIIDFSKEILDPQMLLKYSDVLITDYSSCYTDFLLLNRPVIFYCYDLDFYLSKSNEMYFDYDEVTPGPKVKSFDDLLESLGQILENGDTFAEERKRVLNIFYSPENQGIVSKKQVKYIMDILLK